MKWQTIDTAPKDGTSVLLWIPWSDYPVVCYYGDPLFSGGWIIEDENMRCTGDGLVQADFCTSPTHWMPLPPPPEAEE